MAKKIIVCADCEGTPEQLERLWRVVERCQLKVNFFFTGETALDNRDLVREIALTQNVDSHTFSHPNLRSLTKSEQRDEILRGKNTVESVIGRETLGFRAPYHSINRDTVDLLNEEGFVYDLSGLYFRYHMRKVIEIRPSWFREWMEIYGSLNLSPRFAWDIVKGLYKIFDPLVIPLHPHYSGRSDLFAAAMEEFMLFALQNGSEFCFVPDYLKQAGKWGNGR